MSTKVVRSLSDFLRHGYDVDVECRCGHTNTLDAREVYAKFQRKGWPTSLQGAVWLPSVHAYFRCTECGTRGAKHGELYR